MSITVTFSDQPQTNHSVQIMKQLSQGKFTVYQAYLASKRTTYALKVFPKDAFGVRQYAKETLMFDLFHKNVIQSFPVKSITASDSSESVDFHSIITELAENGDFFDLTIRGCLDSETLIRTYFHQLIAGIEYIHSQGVAHLDLKLENLMLGSDFTLKIIDFDQAQRTTDKAITSGGTQAFRSPEVLDEACKNLAAADIYSAGIILFAMMSQRTPFAETAIKVENKKIITLEHYDLFNDKNKAFWESKISEKKSKISFSSEFKELINGMLKPESKGRFSIEEIKKSKWFKGPVLSAKRLETEMKTKCEI